MRQPQESPKEPPPCLGTAQCWQREVDHRHATWWLLGCLRGDLLGALLRTRRTFVQGSLSLTKASTQSAEAAASQSAMEPTADTDSRMLLREVTHGGCAWSDLGFEAGLRLGALGTFWHSWWL